MNIHISPGRPAEAARVLLSCTDLHQAIEDLGGTVDLHAENDSVLVQLDTALEVCLSSGERVLTDVLHSLAHGAMRDVADRLDTRCQTSVIVALSVLCGRHEAPSVVRAAS